MSGCRGLRVHHGRRVWQQAGDTAARAGWQELSEREPTVVPRFSLTKPTPSDITPPARPYHLSLLNQTAPQTGDHVFQITEPVGDILLRHHRSLVGRSASLQASP